MGAKKDKLRRGKDKLKPKRRKVEKRVYRRKKDDIELYCVCRQTWDGNSLMVQCDQCQGWFHPKCVGVSTKEAKDMPFVCPSCQDKPILNLINYQMGSFNKRMQHSYYESIDPKRLYQMYSIPDISKYQGFTTPAVAADHHVNNILSEEELSQIHNKVLFQMNQSKTVNSMDIDDHDETSTDPQSIDIVDTLCDDAFHREILSFVHNKMNKVQSSSCN